jgi:hypothetical protein
LKGRLIEVDPDPEPTTMWLYARNPRGHNIRIVFRSGLLSEVSVGRENADKSITDLMHLDETGVAAAEPYREALGAKPL